MQVVSQQQTDQISPQKAVRILSIDGGGIRGVAVAKILQKIEEQTKKSIHELFDVIVGTSTGGLLAVMMSVEVPPVPASVPSECDVEDDRRQRKRKRQTFLREKLGLRDGEVLTARQAKRLYKLKAQDIFHEDAGFFHRLFEKHWLLEKIVHLFDTKYEKGVGLKKVVKDLYINNSFKHARTCVGVVVTERGLGRSLLLNSTNAKVKCHHNYHNNLPLTKLIRATSAAPTYFKAIHIHNPCLRKKEKEAKKAPEVEKKEKEKIALTSSFWENRTIEHELCKRQTLFFEDGGVTCNNPSIKGLKYAKELLKLHDHDPHEYQFQIYSLGTGATEYDEVNPTEEIIEKLEKEGGKVQSGNWDALHRLAFNDPFEIATQSYKNHLKIQEKLNLMEKRTGIQHKYFRLQFKVDKKVLAKLDDSSKAHLKLLTRAAKTCIEENKVFGDIIEALKIKVDRPKDLHDAQPNIKLDLKFRAQMRLCMMDKILEKIKSE